MNAVALAMVSLVVAVFGRVFLPPFPVLCIAIAFGIVFTATVLFILKSFETGPLGMSSLIINSSLLVSIIGGILIWKETLSLKKGIGIMLIILLLFMSGDVRKHRGCGKEKWLLFSIGAFLGNGILSLIQKAVTSTYPDMSSVNFNFWAYAFAALVCSVISLLMWCRKERFEEYKAEMIPFLCCALGQGSGSMAGAVFMMKALNILPAIVVYPITQGGQVILLWLAGILIYRDKVQVYDLVKMAIGLTGIMFLSGTINLST